MTKEHEYRRDVIFLTKEVASLHILLKGWEDVSAAYKEDADYLRATNKKLVSALMECAAEWSTPPTTVIGATSYISRELMRRMEVAAAALREHVK